MNLEKYSNHIYDLTAMQTAPLNDVQIALYLIRNCHVKSMPQDRLVIYINTLVQRKLLVPNPSEKIYNFKPEKYALELDGINLVNIEEHGKVFDVTIVLLVNIYMMTELDISDIRVKWIVNTLIYCGILKDDFDAVNFKADSFLQLFNLNKLDRKEETEDVPVVETRRTKKEISENIY